MMIKLYFLVLVCFLCLCMCVEISRKDLGYPKGYLSNCPGSEKPARISRKLLKELRFTVQDPSDPTARRSYSYAAAADGIASSRHVDFARRTVVFISGFLDSANFAIPRVISGAYAKLGYNAIVVDTMRFTAVYYPVASRLTRAVGKHVARVLAQLTERGLRPERTELLGMSLGGHTVGYVAKNFRLFTGRNVSRITALDPAGPCFRNLPPSDRLDASDADFVDVINTNIDGFGMATPVGHLNFYVNGGEYQPGDLEWIPCTTLCSHFRAPMLWLSSLSNPDGFIAMKCDSVQAARDGNCFDAEPQQTNVLGLKTDKAKQGIYYLATRNDWPYFLGADGLKRENEVWNLLRKLYNKEDELYFS